MAKEQLEYAKGTKLYDLLYNTLNECLTGRPKNAVSIIDAYLPRKGTKKGVLENSVTYVSSEQVAIMKTKLFADDVEEENLAVRESGEDLQYPIRNIFQSAFLFEQVGIGVGREEQFRILLSLKQLALEHHANEIRFWGKMFGIHADYFIAEVELMDYREGDEEEETDEQIQIPVPSIEEYSEDISNGPEECDRLPKSTWQPPLIIPPEPTLTGANQKVYFVCNQPGETWTRLPNVTPAQIVCSRNIRKFLTGSLKVEICSFPPFPGNEANYLRSLIARITASTHISPIGYYSLPGEEEDEDLHETFYVNPEFEGLSSRELANPTMCNWVHHSQYILEQGRCTWHNPNVNPEDDLEEPEEGDEIPESSMTPESGPLLLASVALDKNIGYTPAWSIKSSSEILPQHAVTVAKSNLWPGAYTVARGKTFENIYIGWGSKYYPSDFNPCIPGFAAAEYVKDEEIQEFPEPTLEMERLVQNKDAEEIELERFSDEEDEK